MTLNVLDFGADNTGATSSTAAFNSAIKQAVSLKEPLYMPTGTYLLEELDDIYDQNYTERRTFVLRGAGRDNTVLKMNIDSGSLFHIKSFGQGSRPSFQFEDFTIDGEDRTPANNATLRAIYVEGASKSRLSRLAIRNVQGLAISGREWWDSNIDDVLLQSCGSDERLLPAMRLENLDPAEVNSSCNNIFCSDLHIEDHPFRALDLLDSTRKITLVDFKAHHTPDPLPEDDPGHVLIDSRSAAVGASAITFLGPNLARCAGSSVKITSATTTNAPFGLSIVGGSLSAATKYGVEIVKCAGFTANNLELIGNELADFLIRNDVTRVSIPLGLNMSYSEKETDTGGQVNIKRTPACWRYIDPVSGDAVDTDTAAVVDNKIAAGVDLVPVTPASGLQATIDIIAPGTHGQVISLRGTAGRTVVVNDHSVNGGNIDTHDETYTLTRPTDYLRLQFDGLRDSPDGRWVVI